jgi:hypothetical protein
MKFSFLKAWQSLWSLHFRWENCIFQILPRPKGDHRIFGKSWQPFWRKLRDSGSDEYLLRPSSRTKFCLLVRNIYKTDSCINKEKRYPRTNLQTQFTLCSRCNILHINVIYFTKLPISLVCHVQSVAKLRT